jgi:hexosaminidase
MVEAAGKQVLGWHEYLKATPPTDGVAQYWGTTNTNDLVVDGAERGNKILMSPASKAYLDQKYDENTPLGLSWAGYTEVDDAYDWNPGTFVTGVPESAVLGVEAPLWSETLENSDHIEFMAFPRLPAIAELAWSPWSTHDWSSFRTRLAEQGPRWEAMGIDFYRSPKIDW